MTNFHGDAPTGDTATSQGRVPDVNTGTRDRNHVDITGRIAVETPRMRAKRAKTVANWLLGEFTRLLHLADIDIEEARGKVTPEHLMEMLELIDEGTLSGAAAKTVFEEMFNSGRRAGEITAEKGLTQISDAQEMEETVAQVVAANAQAVADFKKGKERALTFLVGQVMRQTRGRANPSVVNKLLREKLEESA